jgi:hypothetical protein
LAGVFLDVKGRECALVNLTADDFGNCQQRRPIVGRAVKYSFRDNRFTLSNHIGIVGNPSSRLVPLKPSSASMTRFVHVLTILLLKARRSKNGLMRFPLLPPPSRGRNPCWTLRFLRKRPILRCASDRRQDEDRGSAKRLTRQPKMFMSVSVGGHPVLGLPDVFPRVRKGIDAGIIIDYCPIQISTRRFLALPVSSLLHATGAIYENVLTALRLTRTFCLANNRATASARRPARSSLLDHPPSASAKPTM